MCGSNLDNLETNLHITCANEGDTACHHRATTEKLQAQITAILSRYDRTTNGTSGQSTKRRNGKRSTDTSANLTDVRKLGDKSRDKTDVTTRGETKDDGKDNDAGCVVDGDPDAETKECRNKGDGDHYIESTKLVSNNAWDDTTEDARTTLTHDIWHYGV
ncbi:hypothetical protein HG531_006091 [Fusarium graminearum]|nr:hypothetical protein HG531_006091 [Fusarium graminearum]